VDKETPEVVIPRIRLKEDEYKLILEHRALQDECEDVGIPLENVNHYWYKGKSFSLHVKKDTISYSEVRKELLEELDNYSPTYKNIERKKSLDPHCLVIDPADIHIGKLCTSFESGEDYNTQIAVARVIEGVQGILDKASGFNIDKIVFIGGNDVLHIDTPKRTTTAGTPQDTDGMWYNNFLIAKKLYVEVIEHLLGVADVDFVFNPSNHDYTNGFFLADVIQSWFRKSPNIKFDCSISHRKYLKYHNNLIGTTHGDGAKSQDLPLLMAQESPQNWATTKHRYVYTHHVHHKVSKDYIGVTVESLRSPSGTDSWHHRNGYQHSPKAVEGFIHHPEHGQVARLTHLF
tara:strand:+ start:2198 stop:3235 length:1038 start_codon:yes stop_codon:yes gene_type:complete